MSIHCDNSSWVARAKKMMEITGAQNVSSTPESSADFDISERTAVR
jgi:hypothetical protein